jgi:transcriptional regulator with GAF, ATPase, and Fis domain
LRGDDASRGLTLRGRFNHVIGRSPEMAAVYEMIVRAAQTDATVLLRGETGTGKGLLARAIHVNSARRESAFVHVDCTTLPAALVESELFGHERGAYTGADSRVIGKVEAADAGTLFLDEIGELPLPLQGKLLRVLQSQEFRRIGDDQDRRVDVRIVTATNRDLDQLVARGSFRQDLYYRINVFPMHMPPLRDRPEDIALLVHHFISKYRGRLGKAIDGIAPGALRRFAAYEFPGNVRELENKVHQAMVVAEGPLITEADVALPAGRSAGARPDIARPFRELKQEAIDAFEKAYLTELLREHRGNLARAARAAGMDRKNLWTLVVRHGLDREQFKKP